MNALHVVGTRCARRSSQGLLRRHRQGRCAPGASTTQHRPPRPSPICRAEHLPHSRHQPCIRLGL